LYVGVTGSGKTTIGQHAAARLGMAILPMPMISFRRKQSEDASGDSG